MKIFFYLVLSCLLLTLLPYAYAEDPFPSAGRLPRETLEGMRFALDAARGDVKAVESWLSTGLSADVAGEIGLVYSIEKEDLPRVFHVLSDSAESEWMDGAWIPLSDDRYALLYKGMSLRKVRSILGLLKEWGEEHSPRNDRYKHTIFLSDDARLKIGEEYLTLTTPIGAFEFEPGSETSSEWRPKGSEPLRSWSARGREVNVSVYEDEQLWLIAASSDPKNGPIALIIQGIPDFNPLICAAAYGRVDVIRLLAARGASLTTTTTGGTSALHAAAEQSRVESIDALLAEGMNIDAETDRGVTPLMAAVEGPQEKTASFVRQGSPAQPARYFTLSVRRSGANDDFGDILKGRQEDTALFLLSRGADPGLKKRENGETVLFSASRRGMLSLIDRLSQRGVDFDVRNTDGESSVFAAIRSGQPAALDRLIEYGAAWKYKNPSGETPKTVAKKIRERDCVGVLEYREPFHESLGASVNLSKSTEEGYGCVPGLGAFFDLHIRLSPRFSLTTEIGFDVQGTEADLSDPWLVSTEGSPYYEYEHLSAACLLDFSLARSWAWRLSAVAGVGFRLQTSASIRTDSGSWDPVDISDQLRSSGPDLVLGIGLNGFLTGGMFTGLELRYTRSMGGSWTSLGGGLDSISLLIRVGS